MKITTFSPYLWLKELLESNVPDPNSSIRTGDFIVPYYMKEEEQVYPRIAIGVIKNHVKLIGNNDGFLTQKIEDSVVSKEIYGSWVAVDMEVELLYRDDGEVYTLPDWNGEELTLSGERLLMYFLDRIHQTLIWGRQKVRDEYGVIMKVGDATPVYTDANKTLTVSVPVSFEFMTTTETKVDPYGIIKVININMKA